LRHGVRVWYRTIELSESIYSTWKEGGEKNNETRPSKRGCRDSYPDCPPTTGLANVRSSLRNNN
jgi:hypothetical protein